jgi:mannosyltransferase
MDDGNMTHSYARHMARQALPATAGSDDQTTIIPRQRAATSREVVLAAPAKQPLPEAAPALARLAWLVPSLATAVLGFVRLGWPSMWADELATWGMVSSSWRDMGSALGNVDAILGPYYVFLHVWASLFGTSDLALRLPSVIAMAAAVGVTASIGTRLVSPRLGLLTGLLLAVFPATSRYAQEARPYAFVALSAALATAALFALVERPDRRRTMLYAGALVLVGLFHGVALPLLVVAHALVVFILYRAQVTRWLYSAGLGVLAVAPLLVLGATQRKQVAWIPKATFASLVHLPGALFGADIVAGLVLGLAVLSVSLRRPGVAAAMWALVPIGGLYVMGLVSSVWLPRYLIFTLPAWALLAAMPLSRSPVLRGALAVAVVAAVGLPAQLDVRSAGGHGQNSRDAANVISHDMRPGDAIVYGPSSSGEGWVGRYIVARYISPDRRPADLLSTDPRGVAGNFAPTECVLVSACLTNPHRIWLLRIGHFPDPTYGLGADKARILDSAYKVQSIWFPTGLTVALFTKTSG